MQVTRSLEDLIGKSKHSLPTKLQNSPKRMSLDSRKFSKSSTNISGKSDLASQNLIGIRPQSTGLPSKAMVDGPTKHSLFANANPRHLSFSMSPPSAFSPPQSTPLLQRRYSLSAEGKSLWATVTSYKFVTTEKDEVLLHRARQVRAFHDIGLTVSCIGNMLPDQIWRIQHRIRTF